MKATGSSEVVLRSCNFFCTIRPKLLYTRATMSTSHPTYRVWHPNRGILFASTQPQSGSRQDTPRSISTVAPAVKNESTVTAHPSRRGLVVSETRKDAAFIGSGRRFYTHDGVNRDSLPRTETADDGTKAQGAEETATGDSKETELNQELPYPALDYKVSRDAFREAKQARVGSLESFWSYNLYRGPGSDGPEQKVKVHYCRSKHTMERVMQYFMNEKVVGFDLEWAADALKWQGPKRNVSLIQLASPSRIALFHVALHSKNDQLVAPSFKKFMEDPEITKVGVWIKGDATRLRNFLSIESKGLMELSHLYKLVKYSTSGEVQLVNKKLVPLAKQVEEYLHLPMFKGQDVRMSDWTQPLRMDQIVYSASDAYAGVQLHAILEHHRNQLDPCPPTPHHAERNLPIRLAEGVQLPSSDDAEEPIEPTDVRGKTPSRLSKAYLASVQGSIQVEPDDDDGGDANSIDITRTRKSTPKPASRPKDDRVLAAETWLAKYRASHPKMRAAPAATRAYYIWHSNEGLDPGTIAQLLREPPLQTNTVVSYILEAIKLERLPYDRTRLKTEVLSVLPKDLASSRYQALWKAVKDVDVNGDDAANKT